MLIIPSLPQNLNGSWLSKVLRFAKVTAPPSNKKHACLNLALFYLVLCSKLLLHMSPSVPAPLVRFCNTRNFSFRDRSEPWQTQAKARHYFYKSCSPSVQRDSQNGVVYDLIRVLARSFGNSRVSRESIP